MMKKRTMTTVLPSPEPEEKPPFDYAAPGLRPGARLYSRCGSLFEFGEVLDEKRWIIYPTFESHTYDGDYETYASDQPIIVDPRQYYPKPPKPHADHSIAEADQKLQTLRQQIRDAEAELRQFAVEEKARLARITRHDQLKRLDDYISGKITHYVVLNETEIKIEEFSGAKCTSDKKAMRLLMLFGDSKGQLDWRLSSYSDDSGSGNKYQCYPHFSYDDALVEVKGVIEDDFDRWREVVKMATVQNPVVPARAVRACMALKQDLPDDIVAAMRQSALATAGRKVGLAREALTKAVQEYTEIARK